MSKDTKPLKKKKKKLCSLSLHDGVQCTLDNFLYTKVVGTLKGQLPKDDLSRDGEMEFWQVL